MRTFHHPGRFRRRRGSRPAEIPKDGRDVPPQGGRSTRTKDSLGGYDNILFIAEARSLALEKTIERRIGQKSLGFHTDAQPSTAQRRNIEMLEQVPTHRPDSFMGLIPDLSGALPVVGCWAIWTRAR